MAKIIDFPARQDPSDRVLEGIAQMRKLISYFSEEPSKLTPIEVCRFVLYATVAELEPDQKPELAKELRSFATALTAAHCEMAQNSPTID